jgi:hypothetical protein
MSASFDRARLAAASGVLIGALLIGSSPALAETGNVTVTATNNAKLTMTIGAPTAGFGTTLDPTGTGTGGQVSATALGTGSQGVYYVWSPGGTLVTVKSNKVWNGTVQAAENSGSAASLSLASGALRYGTTAPTTYSAASAAASFTTTPATWQTNAPKGTSTYSYNYFLRVDWNDDPGTFSSTVTYTASQ